MVNHTANNTGQFDNKRVDRPKGANRCRSIRVPLYHANLTVGTRAISCAYYGGCSKGLENDLYRLFDFWKLSRIRNFGVSKKIRFCYIQVSPGPILDRPVKTSKYQIFLDSILAAIILLV